MLSYKVLPNDTKIKYKGILSGSVQPGYDSRLTKLDKDRVARLKQGESINEVGIDDELIYDLEELYKNGVRVIYCLAHCPPDRNIELIKLLWERKPNTKYITKINDIDIKIEDFSSPSQKQLNVITSDAIDRINQGEHILVHCGAGVGRTGTVLAAIEMKAQSIYDTKEIIKIIRSEYISNAVEGENQKRALNSFSSAIQKEKIIEVLSNINSIIQDKNYALISAINLNLQSEISKLLDADLENVVNSLDLKAKNNALRFSIKENKIEFARICVNKGANVNTQDDNNSSLLHIAVLDDNKSIIDLLLKKKEINLNLKNSMGQTPLMLAVFSKNIMLIKKLLSTGASLEGITEDAIGSEVINQLWIESLKDGDFLAVRSLAEFKPGVITEKIESVYPAYYAIKNNQTLLYVQMVCLKMNIKDTAVNRARLIISEDPLLLVKILANEVNLDLLRDKNRMLPKSCIEYWNQENLNQSLKLAIEDNDVSLVCNLKQLNNNFKEYSLPCNPVIYAIEMGKNILAIEMTKVGFRSVKYNEIDNLKNALKLSVDLGEEFYVKDLIRQGVTIDNSDLLASAIENENIEIVKIIANMSPINKKYGLHEATVLITAIEVDNSEIIDLLLSENPDLSQSDIDNKTALMHAVKGTSPSNIAKLIANGADINQMIVDSSAIMEATILNKPSILEILLKDHNANINLQDLSGETSLMKSKDIRILKILIQQGADLRIVDGQGKSTMSHLVDNYGPSIAEKIKEIASESSNPEIISSVECLINTYNQTIYDSNFLKLTKAFTKGRSDSVVTICEEISLIGGGKYNEYTIEEIREIADDDTISIVEGILSPVKNRTESSPSTLSFDGDLTDLDNWIIDYGSPDSSRKSTLSGRYSASIDRSISPDYIGQQDKKYNDSSLKSLSSSKSSGFTDGDLNSQGSFAYPAPKAEVFYKSMDIKHEDIVRAGGSLLNSGLDVEANHAFSSVTPAVAKIIDKKMQKL